MAVSIATSQKKPASGGPIKANSSLQKPQSTTTQVKHASGGPIKANSSLQKPQTATTQVKHASGGPIKSTNSQNKPGSGGPIKANDSQQRPQKPAPGAVSSSDRKQECRVIGTAGHKQVPLSTVENPGKHAGGSTVGHHQATGGRSSGSASSSAAKPPGKPAPGSTPNQIADSKEKSNRAGDDVSLVYITLYLFRGTPDAWYKRHVLAYFTSPNDPNFHETAHVQRDDDESPWVPQRESGKKNWPLSRTYLSHVNAGTVRVKRGQEMAPVNIFASTDVTGREEQSDWNCQHYVLEGLKKLVHSRYQTQEWYNAVEEELMDKMLDGAVA